MDDLTSRHETDFHLRSTFWLSVTAGTLILPFAYYHLTYQHGGIGIGAVITSLSLYLVAWSCHRKKYKTIYTFIWLGPFTTLFVAYLTEKLGITPIGAGYSKFFNSTVVLLHDVRASGMDIKYYICTG